MSFMHVNVGMLSNIGFSLPWCMYIIASKFHQVVGLSGHKLSPLKQGFGFKPCGWKKVIGRGDPTKGGQSSSPAEISHQQSWWILCTNVMVTKKNNIHVYLTIIFKFQPSLAYKFITSNLGIRFGTFFFLIISPSNVLKE